MIRKKLSLLWTKENEDENTDELVSHTFNTEMNIDKVTGLTGLTE